MIALTDLWGHPVPWWGAIAAFIGGGLAYWAAGRAYEKLVRRRP